VFDFRYHVASLAAVFFALVIGILVGVALASHGLGKAERKRLERSLERAEQRADDLQQQLAARENESRGAREFVARTYDSVMDDRLRGVRVGVLFVGSVDSCILRSVNQTLADGDAPPLLRLRSVTVPIDVGSIGAALRSRKRLAAYAGDGNLDDFARELTDEFVVGGETPLWNALQNQLVEEKRGTFARPADAVVIVRTAQAQVRRTARFLSALYDELGGRPIPVVGVETSRTRPSAIAVYRRHSLSSVDNVDHAAGRVALALLLAGGTRGSYGTKPSAADGVLPDVGPRPAPTGG
jgi:Copper transport outer membrane protein, MctB